MSAPATSVAVDLAPARPAVGARVALVLSLLAVPGVIVTWGVVPGGGFTTGVPLALAALVLGLRARPGRMAGGAALLAGVCLAFVAICAIAL
jgi:hypothetical protein